MKIPFVSFILPTIRSIGFNGDILSDLLNCDYRNIEIIIIYDSPEYSLGHIEDFITDNNKNNIAVKIVENEINLGPGESRNIGIDHSKGNYICFVDDDDNLSLGLLSDLYINNKNNPDIIFLSFKDSIGALNNEDFIERFKSGFLYNSNYVIEQIIDSEFYPWQCQPYFYRTDFLRANKLWFPSTYVAEDIAFNTLAITNSKTIKVIKSPFYLYNSRPGTLKSSGGYDRVVDCMFAYFYVFQYNHENKLGLTAGEGKSLIRLSLNFLRFFIFIRVLALSSNSLDSSKCLLDDLLKIVNNSRNLSSSFDSYQIKDFYTNQIQLDVSGSIKLVYNQTCNIISPKIEPMVFNVNNIYIYCAGPFGLSIARLLHDKLKIKNISFIDDNANLFINNKIEEFTVETLENIIDRYREKVSIIVCNPQPWIEEKIIKKINTFIFLHKLQTFNIYSGTSVLFSD